MKLAWPVAIAAALLGILYVEWPFFLNGRASGGATDTLIQIALLQNWSNYLSGYGSWLSPNYFFPLRGTLGYNDGYLISGVLFHLFRKLGLDPIAAYESVYIVIRLVGYVAVIALGIRFLNLPRWAAIFAAWLSLISINLLNQIAHTQLVYAAFVPLGVLLLLDMSDRLERLSDAENPSTAWSAAAAALGFGAFCAAWAITAFYSFFFFVFFVIAFIASLAAFRWQHVQRIAANLIRFPAAGVAIAVGGILPPLALWMVYGGTLNETGGHAWYTYYHPRIQDLVNVGPANWIWSPRLASAYRKLSGVDMDYTELATGFPVLFLMGTVTGAIMILRSRREHAPDGRSVRFDPACVMAALTVAALVTIVTVLRVGNGYTLSFLVWKVMPGASAIRVPSRFFIFVTPLLCLIVGYAAARLYAASAAARLRRAIALVIAAALLTIEQYNSNPPFVLDRARELAFLQSVKSAPDGCRAFYVSVPRYPPSADATMDLYYAHSVDAMLIAAMQRLPTVNGIASLQPRDWNLAEPFKPDYPARVRDYTSRHGLERHLCGLDLRTMQWSRPNSN